MGSFNYKYVISEIKGKLDLTKSKKMTAENLKIVVAELPSQFYFSI